MKLLQCALAKTLAISIALGNAVPITSSAEDKPFYTTFEGAQYSVYADHAVLECAPEGAASFAIPAEMEGVPVTGIAWDSFADCSDLTEVTIPDTVIEVYSSFEGTALYDSQTGIVYADQWVVDCKDKTLTELEIREGTVGIAYEAFQNMDYISDVNLSEGIKYIGENAFFGCTSLKNMKLPDSVISIGVTAFDFCKSLTTINFPEGLKSIGSFAFMFCESLNETIEFPASLEYLGENVFQYSDSVSTINVHEDNPYFRSVDGVLYSKDMQTLICCPPADRYGSFIVPDTVTSIGSFAFDSCWKLTSITLPAGLKVIETEAFRDCMQVKEFVIPEGVTSIGDGAFYNCTSMQRLVLPSTLAEFGTGQFWNCAYFNVNGYEVSDSQIEEIIVAEGNPRYYSQDGVLFEKGENGNILLAYPRCRQGEEYQIPEGVTSIAENAFYGDGNGNNLYLKRILLPSTMAGVSDCKNSGFEGEIVPFGGESVDGVIIEDGTLIYYPSSKTNTVYTVPEGVTAIDIDAFSPWCDHLEKIILPSSMEVVFFSTLPYGVEIEISEENPFYTAENGIVFDKTKETILYYPEWKNDTIYSVPEGVRKIPDGAFSINCDLNTIIFPSTLEEIGESAFSFSDITSITIPERVTNIGKEAFVYSSSLKMISLPKNLTSVGARAFDGCNNLKVIKVHSNIFNPEEHFNLADLNCTIIAHNGSVAQKAAETYHLPFIPLEKYENATMGDTDENKETNALDAAMLLTEAAILGADNAPTFSEQQNTVADLNYDNTIDAIDATMILQYAAAVGAGESNIPIEAFI